MTGAASLPVGFEALEPFVERWTAGTSLLRDQRRGDSTAAERRAFFDVAAPLLTPAFALLDAKPLAELDMAEKRLLNLMLNLAHIQMAVEVHGDSEPQHAAARAVMKITRSVSDFA